MWSRELGKQLYLGGFDAECEAARAFDVCSLKKWRDERGASATAATTAAAAARGSNTLAFSSAGLSRGSMHLVRRWTRCLSRA